MVVSVLGSLFAFMTMAPRVYYAMARDGAVPAFVGEARPAHRRARPRDRASRPALACLLVALGTFDAIVAYFVFVTVAFLGLTVVGRALPRCRGRERRALPRSRAVPCTPLVFLVAAGAVLLVAAGRRASPRQALLRPAVRGGLGAFPSTVSSIEAAGAAAVRARRTQ